MVWRILEPIILLALVVVFLSQLVLPPFIGKPFFWLFRKTDKNLLAKENELMDAKTELEARRLDKRIKATKKTK